MNIPCGFKTLARIDVNTPICLHINIYVFFTEMSQSMITEFVFIGNHPTQFQGYNMIRPKCCRVGSQTIKEHLPSAYSFNWREKG